MEISRGTAYGLGLSQCAITLGVVLFLPAMEVHVFTAHVQLRNGSLALADQRGVYGSGLMLGLPLLLSSGLAALFSTVTCRMHEEGLTGQDFQPEIVEQVAMWDLLFWSYCLIAHGILALVLSTPADCFGCLSATCFMVYFLFRACAPKHQQVNLTQENLNILGYCLGVLQLGYQIPEASGNGMSLLMLMVVVDYFLGVGHTWDRSATLETVINCRLFYICCSTIGLAGLYGLWERPA